jgi:ectoine hydroxylase-related dioxygenase (phytanoyl-CoA dioxygenase family)
MYESSKFIAYCLLIIAYCYPYNVLLRKTGEDSRPDMFEQLASRISFVDRGQSTERCMVYEAQQQLPNYYSSMGEVLSNEALEFYQENGAVVLRNVLSSEETQTLRQGIEVNLKHPGLLAAVASDKTDPGEFFEDFCNWQRINEYQAIVFQSELPQIASKLMQSSSVRLYHDHLLVKQAKTRQQTPWHQDQPYYNISGYQNVSFWIPVDPVPEESSLLFAAGSHASKTWYQPRTFLTEQAKWFPDESLPEIPPVDSSTILSWALEPGDVVAFHMLTMHSSRGTQDRRRAFSIRYLGDDIRHAPRPWRTSPEFPNLSQELAAGVPMDHPLFPLVLQRHT